MLKHPHSVWVTQPPFKETGYLDNKLNYIHIQWERRFKGTVRQIPVQIPSLNNIKHCHLHTLIVCFLSFDYNINIHVTDNMPV